MIVTLPPNTTLLRLVVNNPDKFYPQDWYYDEQFANYAMDETSWSLTYNTPLPAVVWAYAYIKNIWSAHLEYNYIWTSDTDNFGDKVYIGRSPRSRKPGLQIHRHLTINPDHFLNSLEGR